VAVHSFHLGDVAASVNTLHVRLTIRKISILLQVRRTETPAVVDSVCDDRCIYFVAFTAAAAAEAVAAAVDA